MTEIIERLSFRSGTKYSATEAAIHLARYLPARRYCAGKHVLDVACGEGYGAHALAERWSAARVDAVDISPEAIEAARANFPSPKIAYHCAGADDLEARFASASFDVVTSFETVEHVPDAGAFLTALAGLAKRDGVVLVSCPNDHWYYPNPEQRNPYHVRKYTFDEFRALAEQHLGAASDWLFGWPVGGFVNAPREQQGLSRTGQAARDILAGDAVEALSVPSEETLSPDNCSYFLGVWDRRGTAARAEAPSAVLHPSSMDWFASRWAAESLRDEVRQVKTELWNARHRGELRGQLLECIDELDRVLARAGASLETSASLDQEGDLELVRALHVRARALRDAQIAESDLRIRLRNAELHRQAAEIENKLVRERVHELLAAREAAKSLPRRLAERSIDLARRQVGRARALAGSALRRLRGR